MPISDGPDRTEAGQQMGVPFRRTLIALAFAMLAPAVFAQQPQDGGPQPAVPTTVEPGRAQPVPPALPEAPSRHAAG